MPNASAMHDVLDGAEVAVAAIEQACISLNHINAGDEVDRREEVERLVVLLQRLDTARASVSWSEDWV